MRPNDSSILTPKEIQLCLVLQALIQELVVLVEQIEALDSRQRRSKRLYYK